MNNSEAERYTMTLNVLSGLQAFLGNLGEAKQYIVLPRNTSIRSSQGV